MPVRFRALSVVGSFEQLPPSLTLPCVSDASALLGSACGRCVLRWVAWQGRRPVLKPPARAQANARAQMDAALCRRPTVQLRNARVRVRGGGRRERARTRHRPSTFQVRVRARACVCLRGLARHCLCVPLSAWNVVLMMSRPDSSFAAELLRFEDVHGDHRAAGRLRGDLCSVWHTRRLV